MVVVVCEGVVAFFSCNSLNARNHVGAGVPVTVDQALILSSKPAFSAAPTASSCAGRHVRVSLVLDVAVGSDASLFRGNASESAENGAPARAARNVRRRAHESGTATICARTGALMVIRAPEPARDTVPLRGAVVRTLRWRSRERARGYDGALEY